MTTSTVNKIIDDIIAVEGGYTVDTGGPTRYGITEKVARDNGYTGDMRDLPLRKARDIYFKRYVDEPGFDRIINLSDAIGAEVVDTGVNMGQKVAAEFLQRGLNVLSGAGLTVDGKCGQRTASALADYLKVRGHVAGTKVLLKLLNSYQCVRYSELVEKNPTKYRKYVYGWVANRVEI